MEFIVNIFLENPSPAAGNIFSLTMHISPVKLENILEESENVLKDSKEVQSLSKALESFHIATVLSERRHWSVQKSLAWSTTWHTARPWRNIFSAWS